MAIDLVEYETKAREAVQAFWGNREQARRKQIESGRVDAGERGAVTAGKNMDGFIALVIALVRANGLADAEIYRSRALLTLPGYFRPTKLWDLLVFHKGRLVAALECKSQVGPSFGNNFNNRAEEAIGTAHDFQCRLPRGREPSDRPRARSPAGSCWWRMPPAHARRSTMPHGTSHYFLSSGTSRTSSATTCCANAWCVSSSTTLPA